MAWLAHPPARSAQTRSGCADNGLPPSRALAERRGANGPRRPPHPDWTPQRRSQNHQRELRKVDSPALTRAWHGRAGVREGFAQMAEAPATGSRSRHLGPAEHCCETLHAQGPRYGPPETHREGPGARLHHSRTRPAQTRFEWRDKHLAWSCPRAGKFGQRAETQAPLLRQKGSTPARSVWRPPTPCAHGGRGHKGPQPIERSRGTQLSRHPETTRPTRVSLLARRRHGVGQAARSGQTGLDTPGSRYAVDRLIWTSHGRRQSVRKRESASPPSGGHRDLLQRSIAIFRARAMIPRHAAMVADVPVREPSDPQVACSS